MDLKSKAREAALQRAIDRSRERSLSNVAAKLSTPLGPVKEQDVHSISGRVKNGSKARGNLGKAQPQFRHTLQADTQNSETWHKSNVPQYVHVLTSQSKYHSAVADNQRQPFWHDVRQRRLSQSALVVQDVNSVCTTDGKLPHATPFWHDSDPCFDVLSANRPGAMVICSSLMQLQPLHCPPLYPEHFVPLQLLQNAVAYPNTATSDAAAISPALATTYSDTHIDRVDNAPALLHGLPSSPLLLARDAILPHIISSIKSPLQLVDGHYETNQKNWRADRSTFDSRSDFVSQVLVHGAGLHAGMMDRDEEESFFNYFSTYSIGEGCTTHH